MRGQFMRGNRDAARRSQERREREDAAVRLHDAVPGLTSLSLELQEVSGEDVIVKYVRRVVLERAPALFVIPCTDPACEDGGHDVTAPILRALRGARTQFDGEHACDGHIGHGECKRVLRYMGIAGFSG
jgi:hypothetical protein